MEPVASDPPNSSDGRGTFGRPTAEAARRVHVDAQLRIGFSDMRLLADDHSVSWGKVSVPYTEIVAMIYWVTKVTTIGAHNFDYLIMLFSDEKMKPEKIALADKSEHARIAYDNAVDALLRFTGAPILSTTVSQLDKGESASAAGLCQIRVLHGKKSVSWGTAVRSYHESALGGKS